MAISQLDSNYQKTLSTNTTSDSYTGDNIKNEKGQNVNINMKVGKEEDNNLSKSLETLEGDKSEPDNLMKNLSIPIELDPNFIPEPFSYDVNDLNIPIIAEGESAPRDLTTLVKKLDIPCGTEALKSEFVKSSGKYGVQVNQQSVIGSLDQSLHCFPPRGNLDQPTRLEFKELPNKLDPNLSRPIDLQKFDDLTHHLSQTSNLGLNMVDLGYKKYLEPTEQPVGEFKHKKKRHMRYKLDDPNFAVSGGINESGVGFGGFVQEVGGGSVSSKMGNNLVSTDLTKDFVENIVAGELEASQPPPLTVENWAQCENCKKWRRLPISVDTEKLPETWVCALNVWDPIYNSCSVPEELYPEQTQVKVPLAPYTSYAPRYSGGMEVGDYGHGFQEFGREPVRFERGVSVYEREPLRYDRESLRFEREGFSTPTDNNRLYEDLRRDSSRRYSRSHMSPLISNHSNFEEECEVVKFRMNRVDQLRSFNRKMGDMMSYKGKTDELGNVGSVEGKDYGERGFGGCEDSETDKSLKTRNLHPLRNRLTLYSDTLTSLLATELPHSSLYLDNVKKVKEDENREDDLSVSRESRETIYPKEDGNINLGYAYKTSWNYPEDLGEGTSVSPPGRSVSASGYLKGQGVGSRVQTKSKREDQFLLSSGVVKAVGSTKDVGITRDGDITRDPNMFGEGNHSRDGCPNQDGILREGVTDDRSNIRDGVVTGDGGVTVDAGLVKEGDLPIETVQSNDSVFTAEGAYAKELDSGSISFGERREFFHMFGRLSTQIPNLSELVHDLPDLTRAPRRQRVEIQSVHEKTNTISNLIDKNEVMELLYSFAKKQQASRESGSNGEKTNGLSFCNNFGYINNNLENLVWLKEHTQERRPKEKTGNQEDYPMQEMQQEYEKENMLGLKEYEKNVKNHHLEYPLPNIRQLSKRCRNLDNMDQSKSYQFNDSNPDEYEYQDEFGPDKSCSTLDNYTPVKQKGSEKYRKEKNVVDNYVSDKYGVAKYGYEKHGHDKYVKGKYLQEKHSSNKYGHHKQGPDKYVGEKYLSEKNVGDKYVTDKFGSDRYVSEKYGAEKYGNEKYLQEKYPQEAWENRGVSQGFNYSMLMQPIPDDLGYVGQKFNSNIIKMLSTPITYNHSSKISEEKEFKLKRENIGLLSLPIPDLGGNSQYVI